MKKAAAITIILLTFPAILAFYINLPPSMMQSQVFEVRYGEPLKKTSRRLKNQNLITSEKAFLAIAHLTNKKNMRTGKYELHAGMSMLGVLIKLTRGDVLTKKITIPEGFNIYQISERLNSSGISSSGSFIYYCFDEDFLKTLRIKSNSCEGYLFPDTYVFPESSDPRDVISAMHSNLRKHLKESDIEEGNSNLGLHGILTLASLIEKEAKKPVERKYISSVFINRLAGGMKLDCDPTIRYALKKFSGRIGYRDLEFDSPYNTYLYKNLPPTPICSPGIESIKAALEPEKTDFLYFVARNDGSHYFSKTLREHNRAVDYYQKGKKKNGFIDRQKI
ncbi:MAG: endolytic transglycosylase MltG [Spirochaetes bacterium]|jgi:UPF0755 protein|nr:endolytic transglycosylase MltG [Spirochaetota bacterium]